MKHFKTLIVDEDVLSENEKFAMQNCTYFKANNINAINIMSSPGAGKTTLVVKTINDLIDRFKMAVIDGDQETDLDVNKIRATGVPAIQVNTGYGCHLDAYIIDKALAALNLDSGTLLFIENVGNLVCPAEFDLGESKRVVILSVTEGEDKPLKYANIFKKADVVIINKIDLLPYIDFDIAKCEANISEVNSHAKIIKLSPRTGEGMQTWYDLLLEQK